MAGLFGGVGPNAYVNGLYAPREAQLAQQQAARTAGLQNLTGSVLDALKSSADQGDARATALISALGNLSTNAANTLQASSPNESTQAMLRAIGAPQSQQDQVGNQNATSFGGNAGLLKYTAGVLPATLIGQDALSRDSYTRSLPGIVGLAGIQGLGRIGAIASGENSALASAKTNSLQQARSDLASYVQKNQALKAQAQKTAFDQNLATAKYRTGVDEFNTNTKLRQQSYNLQVTKAQYAQANADRAYGLSYDRFVASERKAARTRSSGGITPTALSTIQRRAEVDAETFYHGIPASTRADGSVSKPGVPALTYQQSIKRLMTRYPALGPKGAIKIADSLYQPGEGGRSLSDPQFAQNINSDVLSQPASGVVGGGNRQGDVVKFASNYLGVPYVWGGNSPKTGLDCSGFIQQTYRRIGVNLPRTTYEQVKVGKPVSLSNLRPGDAIFTIPGPHGPEHVAMYIGHGQVQVSPSTGDVNKIVSLQSYLSLGFVAARRYIGG
jgi:cell wall-associated NlpC family hydrolase